MSAYAGGARDCGRQLRERAPVCVTHSRDRECREYETWRCRLPDLIEKRHARGNLQSASLVQRHPALRAEARLRITSREPALTTWSTRNCSMISPHWRSLVVKRSMRSRSISRSSPRASRSELTPRSCVGYARFRTRHGSLAKAEYAAACSAPARTPRCCGHPVPPLRAARPTSASPAPHCAPPPHAYAAEA